MALPAAAALAILLSLQVQSAAEEISYEQQQVRSDEVFPIIHSYDSNKEQNCRWKIVSQPGYMSRLECSTINLPSSPGCSMDQLKISSTDARIGDHVYCDRGKVRLVVMGPRIDMVLKTSPATPGGNFSCNVTAMLNNCSCGYKYPQPLPTSRIVNGSNTGVNEFPMVVLLKSLFDETYSCGGTIISQQFVLTAAHCVSWVDITELQVYVGEHDVNATDESPATQRLDVAEIIVHGLFNYSNVPDDVDIALLRLARDIQFSERVGPACLPFKYTEQNLTGTVLTLIGWGRLNETNMVQPNMLQKVDVQVVTLESCRNVFPNIKPKNFCTYTHNKDLCKGDSGGPALYTEPGTGRQFIRGIISSSAGCARPGYPGIHVNVAAMLGWIMSHTPGVQYCAK